MLLNFDGLGAWSSVLLQILEDAVSPDSWSRPVHDARASILGRAYVQGASGLLLERLLGDVGDDVSQNGVPRFRPGLLICGFGTLVSAP